MNILTDMRDRLAWKYHCVFPATASRLVEHGAVLVDVREADEWHAGHAPRARHIPLGQLRQRLDELPEQRPVILVSRSGRRARRAAAFLADRGHRASNLTGGMRAWAREGLPVIGTDDGSGSVR
jgi:rhodanese-related sulfurtransferase